MHERERHRIILSAVQEKSVVTIQDISELTDASEATIRRDIAALHVQGKIRRVRGGAEAVHPPQLGNLAGRPFRVSESVNIDKKRSIARAAVDLCEAGDAIIINGGTTTFQMVHYMAGHRMQVSIKNAQSRAQPSTSVRRATPSSSMAARRPSRWCITWPAIACRS